MTDKITPEIKEDIDKLENDTQEQEKLDEEIKSEDIEQETAELESDLEAEPVEAKKEKKHKPAKKPEEKLPPTEEPDDFNLKGDDEKGESLDDEDISKIDKDIENDDKEISEVDKKLEKINKKIKKDIPSDVDETQALIDELKEEKVEAPKVEVKPQVEAPKDITTHIYGLRTTANREDQVMDFMTSNAEKKKFNVYSIIRAHGMRGYIFVEAESRQDAEQAAFGVPYARGILPKEIEYKEIEHMLEQVKREVNIQQNDIVEIISGPFKRENAKIIRLDKTKEEVVVELLEAAVPIPITLRMDAVKVIRRESGEVKEEISDE